MISRSRTLLGLAAVAFALLAPPASSFAEKASVHDHSGLDHHTIRIRERRVTPERAEVPEVGTVAWVNYTPEVLVVSFDESVADQLVCTGPSNFTLSGGRLVSKPLRANEFASVCHFKPGTYSYEVKMLTIAHSGGPDLGRTVTGQLVVK